jgi:hypothetical protein
VTEASGYSRYPSLAIDGDDNLHLAWQDDRDWGGQYAYYRMRAGSVWLEEHIVADDIASSGTPAIAVDGNGHAHIVWYQNTIYTERLFHRKFDGSTWGDTRMITDSRDVYGPTVAIDDSNWVHVAWHDKRHGNYEVFYTRYNGIDWGVDERITTASGISANSSIVVDDSGYVHLVWRDERDGDAQIYYSRKEADTWVLQTRLTKDPGQSAYPSLALAPDGALHMVWRDFRDGNYEIYHKSRGEGSAAGIVDGQPDGPCARQVEAWPNPFREAVEIRLAPDAGRRTDVSIYDVSGRLVWKRRIGPARGGRTDIVWDGHGLDGRRVAPGVYMVSLKAGKQAALAKIVMLR